MFVLDCDYLPTDKVVFPPELALLIVRKTAAVTEVFESQAIDQPDIPVSRLVSI
ncbi:MULTISPECIES: hypothetical protein [unclassified Pseudomonas]|uniref:hypothetical protein n=1 Tax=unclassified Pseudomonas TaxID=196821 RepID=UPI002B2240C2|nr:MULTISPECIES: hypothetical protein [unclassified Pseudomonas]MEA9979452.1 hypothetical protein [Pseudomonas sp. RTS4]MEB0197917.1 hypothetical protein [Pseudomonas sp. 5S4]MEB0246397.1 hypothetical protein [Pseudomonas sp. 10S5]